MISRLPTIEIGARGGAEGLYSIHSASSAQNPDQASTSLRSKAALKAAKSNSVSCSVSVCFLSRLGRIKCQ